MAFDRFLDNSMNERQISAVRESPPQNVFAVVSWGRTATAWLAKVLDSHPDIFAVHEANGTLAELGYGRRLSGLPYLRALGVIGWAYKAAGDVHGITKGEISYLKKKLGDQFGAAIIVREPVARARSFITFHEHFDYAIGQGLTYMDELVKHWGIAPVTLTNKQRIQIHVALMLNEVVAERAIAKIYRCEDLTSKPETLHDLVHTITNGKVEATEDWAKAAVAMPAINDMALKKKDMADHIDGWMQDILRKAVTVEAWDAYAALGYTPPDFLK